MPNWKGLWAEVEGSDGNLKLQGKNNKDWLLLWVRWAHSWLEDSDLVALVIAVAAASLI